MNTIEIERKIDREIAHIMACYGDNPQELMYKLKSLVIQWYCKGVNSGITREKH